MKLILPLFNILNKQYFNFPVLISIIFIFSIFISCSSTKRFSTDSENNYANESFSIRVLLDNSNDQFKLNVDGDIILSSAERKIAKINSGNTIKFTTDNSNVTAHILDKSFKADTFYLTSAIDDGIIKIGGKRYRGKLKLFVNNLQIRFVNQLSLEDYVKGVLTKEMPVGNGKENYEALKAFSICARTYAYNKMNENKLVFDIYPDVRDQVYGGVDGETEYTNNIVDETRGLILDYDGSPAVIFYSSTCGGKTEDVKNVFSNNDLPYLKSVADGDGPYCKISPRFNWEEKYTEQLFISRLYNAKLINSKNYRLKSLSIISRFESGRVNELEIILTDNNQKEKDLSLFGNNIRSIIKTSNDKSILRSTLFEIKLLDDKSVVITGNGNGHGVGLCQWGAIGQARDGKTYEEILNLYFPGTKIKMYYD